MKAENNNGYLKNLKLRINAVYQRMKKGNLKDKILMAKAHEKRFPCLGRCPGAPYGGFGFVG
jgi:hypothetical protein